MTLMILFATPRHASPYTSSLYTNAMFSLPDPTPYSAGQALEFFQQLAASRTATLDVMALNCLAAVHAAAGQTEEAEQAVARAGQLAAMQGMPPPPEATYALVQVGSEQLWVALG